MRRVQNHRSRQTSSFVWNRSQAREEVRPLTNNRSPLLALIVCYGHPVPSWSPSAGFVSPAFRPYFARNSRCISVTPPHTRNRGHVCASFSRCNSADRDCANPPEGDIRSPFRCFPRISMDATFWIDESGVTWRMQRENSRRYFPRFLLTLGPLNIRI